MATKEEIREGIEIEVVKYMMRQGYMIKLPKELSLNIVKRLASQGVVIKVDREPENCYGMDEYGCTMAGRVAVEPLIACDIIK